MTELFLIVRIGNRWAALPAIEIESAVDLTAVVPVPCAPPTVRGLAALRSRVVTVIDTHVALGLPSSPQAARAVIAPVQGHHFALVVDALDDVFSHERQPLPSGLSSEGLWGQCANGIIEHDGRPLLVLVPARLVPGTPALAA